MLQFLAEHRRLLSVCDAVHFRQLLGDNGVKGLAMIVVVGQGGVDLPHREVWMLTFDLLGVPMMGEAIEGNLDDLGMRALNIGHTIRA